MFTVVWYSGPAEIRDESADEQAAIRRARYLCGYREIGIAEPSTYDVVFVVDDDNEIVYDCYPIETQCMTPREIEMLTSGL